jgi:hypothetical protein
MTSIIDALNDKFIDLEKEHKQALEPLILLARAIDEIPNLMVSADKTTLIASDTKNVIDNPVVGYLAAGLIDHIQKNMTLSANGGARPPLENMTYFQEFLFGGEFFYGRQFILHGPFERILRAEINILLGGVQDRIGLKTKREILEEMIEFCLLSLENKITPYAERLAEEFFEVYSPEQMLFAQSDKFKEFFRLNKTKGNFDVGLDSSVRDRNFWLFSPALMADGNNIAEVRTKIRNRWQAYRLYGFLAPAMIHSPQISEKIDEGRSVEKALKALYGLNGHQMNDLKKLAQECDPWRSACKLHGNHETPSALIGSFAGAGASAQEWEVLLKLIRTVHREGWVVVKRGSAAAEEIRNHMCLLPSFAYFFGAESTDHEIVSHKDLGSLQEAGMDLQKDLLDPLYEHLEEILGSNGDSCILENEKQKTRMSIILSSDRYPFTQNPNLILAFKEAREVRRLIRNAIVGNRTIAGFQKDLLELHKFSASIIAKRKAILGQEVTWPTLFPRWRSRNGKQEIEFLTSTTALVQEGLRMRHCVGSYDTICPRGKTHIAAIRIGGESVATLEVKAAIDASKNALILDKGQFKARYNRTPSDAAHQALGAFLHDVEAGRIRCNMKETLDFMTEAALRPASSFHSYGKTLTLKGAEDLWPIYRQTLIFSHPEAHTLQDWVRASGIEGAMKRLAKALTALNAEPTNEVDRPHEAREQHVVRPGPELHSLT